MSHFTEQQRAFCVRQFYEKRSYVAVRRLFGSEYGLHNIKECPSTNLMKQWIDKYERTGSLLKIRGKGRQRTSRTEENIEKVRESMRTDPKLSIRKRSFTLGMPRSTLQRILSLDLKFHPYKIELVNDLNETDFESRLNFTDEMFDKFSEFDNILFTGEAHFFLTEVVNKQNCQYWSNENPKLKELHSDKVTVWAALASWGIIGPYFFEDARSQAVTVNSKNYIEMLREFLSPKLKQAQAYNNNTWLQQDETTYQTSNESIQVIRDMFPRKLIAHTGDIIWPRRSPDLSPLDFFLWGFLKSKVYSNNPATTSQLKANICYEIESISRETCERVFQNFKTRLDECRGRKGRHLDDLLFKT